MNNSFHTPTRRMLLAGFAVLGVLGATSPAWAVSEAKAKALIENVIADIQKIINSGKSDSARLRDFEKIFSRYGDTAIIGQLVLGADGRSASSSQKRGFAEAFKLYISHKYGRRFKEMIGARIEIGKVRKVKSFYEVTTTTILRGQAPFEVIYVVSEKSGKFIDLKIEGISLIKSERAEIGAMLDKRGGNLDKLIADLRKM